MFHVYQLGVKASTDFLTNSGVPLNKQGNIVVNKVNQPFFFAAEIILFQDTLSFY